MDLHYSREYLDFEKEVKAFCKKYDGVTFIDASKNPLASSSSKKKKIQVTRSEWQKILIEQGYFASCLLYTSPSPRDATLSRMPSSA